MSGLKVYGKPDCKWCNKSKEYLDSNNIKYTYIDLSDKKNRTARKLMSDLNVKYIPVFVYDDRYKEINTESESLYLYALERWLKDNNVIK